MSVITTVQLPGLHSPQAGFEAPFDLLSACHERVQRSLDLLGRLLVHLRERGCDDDARSAAHDVFRYFAIAAPAHHVDEELHVLPLLQASGQPHLVAAARQIRADHEQMEAVWQRLGPALQALADPTQAWTPAALAPLQAAAQEFVAIHARHVPLEDDVAFPAARERSNAVMQRAMGAEMAARRRVG